MTRAALTVVRSVVASMIRCAKSNSTFKTFFTRGYYPMSDVSYDILPYVRCLRG